MGDKTVCLLPALLLLTVPGSSAITGPGAVSGTERGPLTVQCRYDPGYEKYVKWWCRGSGWYRCRILVQTSGSEQEVKKGRVSIRDHHKNRTFSMTMEGLRLNDADTYRCGIERAGTDLGTRVQVTILPATTVTTTTTSTTTTTTTITTTTNTTTITSTTTITATTTAPVTPGESKVSPTPSNTSDPIRDILPPLIVAGLLLVLVATSLLAWGLLRRRRRAAPGIAPEQDPESELCYADLVLQPPGSSRKTPARLPSVARMEVEVEYGNVAPRRKENVTYAALSFGAAGREPTYSNTEQHSARTPSQAQEEASEYSTVRKP